MSLTKGGYGERGTLIFRGKGYIKCDRMVYIKGNLEKPKNESLRYVRCERTLYTKSGCGKAGKWLSRCKRVIISGATARYCRREHCRESGILKFRGTGYDKYDLVIYTKRWLWRKCEIMFMGKGAHLHPKCPARCLAISPNKLCIWGRIHQQGGGGDFWNPSLPYANTWKK